MSTISISLDTLTRQVAMTIDGVIQPFDSVYLGSGKFYDGEAYLDFSYSARSANANGLEEIHGYTLPRPPQSDNTDCGGSGCGAAVAVNAQGLVESDIPHVERVSQDIAKFFGVEAAQCSQPMMDKKPTKMGMMPGTMDEAGKCKKK